MSTTSSPGINPVTELVIPAAAEQRAGIYEKALQLLDSRYRIKSGTGPAGMTIIQLISNRYHRRHTRGGGYPVFKTTFYDSINLQFSIPARPG